MRFGKLIDGVLRDPPGMLDGVERTFPPDEEGGEPITGLYQVGYSPADTPAYVEAYLLENGYLPVVEASPGEAPEGKRYEQTGWQIGHDDTANTDEIVPVFALVDDPDPEDAEISAEEALDIIFGGDGNVD